MYLQQSKNSETGTSYAGKGSTFNHLKGNNLLLILAF
jgi:hypothetical protein